MPRNHATRPLVASSSTSLATRYRVELPSRPERNGHMTAEQSTTTIETLTAEVRALMIGKRQVTLSVYRQLDTIPWSEIEPFGRVRDSKDDEHAINVIGRNRKNNALVRSAIR